MVCALEMANETVYKSQSGDMISRVISVGSGIGTIKASGFVVKKFSMLFLDNSSAVVLHTPGIYG